MAVRRVCDRGIQVYVKCTEAGDISSTEEGSRKSACEACCRENDFFRISAFSCDWRRVMYFTFRKSTISLLQTFAFMPPSRDSDSD